MLNLCIGGMNINIWKEQGPKTSRNTFLLNETQLEAPCPLLPPTIVSLFSHFCFYTYVCDFVFLYSTVGGNCAV